MRNIIVTLSLVGIFIFLAISSMLQKSGTCDEIAHHIPAGYSYYKQWDYRLNPYTPPLPRYILALPLNFLSLTAPFHDKSWETADTPVFGRKLIFEYNREKADLIIFLCRLMILCVGVISALLVFLVAGKFYGRSSALFALFLFSFTPEIIAHSSLATIDMAAACFILLSIYSFWKFMNAPTAVTIVLAAIALGLAQLSKYNALLLYPAFLFLIACDFLYHRKRTNKLFRKTLLVFTLSIVVVWGGYGFQIKPFLADTINQDKKIAFVQDLGTRFIPHWDNALSRKTERILREVPLPLTTYITGIFGVAEHTKVGNNTYFLGSWSQHGDRLYYLVAFLIKTPIAILVLLLISLYSTRRKKIEESDLCLIVPIVMMFAAASLSKLQLGLRYLLPVYPLLCIFISRIFPLDKRIRHTIVVGALSCWLCIVTIRAWPDYLAYFNESIGGSDNGWKYLRDSNIDWGQDLPALKKYIVTHNIKEISLSYFGTADPSFYSIKYIPISENEQVLPAKKIYAISAQNLDGYAWTKKTKTTAKAGYSIFIYDFR